MKANFTLTVSQLAILLIYAVPKGAKETVVANSSPEIANRLVELKLLKELKTGAILPYEQKFEITLLGRLYINAATAEIDPKVDPSLRRALWGGFEHERASIERASIEHIAACEKERLAAMNTFWGVDLGQRPSFGSYWFTNPRPNSDIYARYVENIYGKAFGKEQWGPSAAERANVAELQRTSSKSAEENAKPVFSPSEMNLRDRFVAGMVQDSGWEVVSGNATVTAQEFAAKTYVLADALVIERRKAKTTGGKF